MISLLAVHRPTDWNFPLFIHVLGAMILVGGLLAGASLMTYARGDIRFLRLGYWTLLLVAFPAYIVMRIGAQWTYSREGWEKLDDDPTWLGIGFIVADVGALLVLIALIVGGIGVRRLGNGGGQGLLKASMIIAWIVLAAALVAVWAMAGKPELALSVHPLIAGGRLCRPGGYSAIVHATAREGGSWGNRRFHPPQTTTGSTPGSPRSAVRYRAYRSPCGAPCSAHHPTFVGGMQVGFTELRGTCPSPIR